jgi:hypothetical protein
VVPLAEKPDFNGNRRHTFIPVFLLADSIPQHLHSVLQPFALTQTHAEPHENPNSFAQPHAFVPVCLHSDPFSHSISLVQPNSYTFYHADTHGNAPTPHPFHLPGDRCR